MKIISLILIILCLVTCKSTQLKTGDVENYKLINYLLTDTVNIKLVCDGFKVISDIEFPSAPCFEGASSTIEQLSIFLAEEDTSYIRFQLIKSKSFRTDSLSNFGFKIFKTSAFINKITYDSLFEILHKDYGPGVISISMPIYNKEKTRAYIKYGYLCGSLCGNGIDL